MKRKIGVLFLAMALVGGFCTSNANASRWTNASGDGNWFNPGNWVANWTGPGVPTLDTNGAFFDGGADMDFNFVGAESLFLIVSNTSGFSISGGDLTYLGDGLLGFGGPTVINQSGGTVTQTGGGAGCIIGHNASGIYNISGGALVVANTCPGCVVDWTLDGTASTPSALNISGEGVVDVDTVLHFGPAATLNVSGNGKLIWRNHVVEDIYGNTPGTYFGGPPVISDTAVINALVVQVGSDVHFTENTLIAHGPTPDDGATDVGVDQVLKWIPGDDPNNLGSINPKITEHLVYMASLADPNMALKATIPATDPAEYEAGLSMDESYSWRVDEKLEDGTVLTGSVWDFEMIKSVPVLAEPFIKEAVVATGETATFTIGVESLSTPSFAWKKYVEDGDDLDVGVNSETLAIEDAQMDDEGAYYCVVTNEGSGVVTTEMVRFGIKREIGHWTFDETLADSSLNGNDGVQMFEATGDSDPNFGTGIIGTGAIVLNGVDEYIEIPNESDYDFYDAFSVACWIKGVPSPYSGLVAKWTGDEQHWILYQAGGGLINQIRRVAPPQDLLVQSGVNGLDDEWHYVVGTYDIPAGEQKLYVDGALKNQLLENVRPIAKGDAPVIIGANITNCFNGMIDDVIIYNYVLDDVKIALNYTDVMGGDVCLEDPEFDFNGDCIVNLADFAEFAMGWLECNNVPTCISE